MIEEKDQIIKKKQTRTDSIELMSESMTAIIRRDSAGKLGDERRDSVSKLRSSVGRSSMKKNFVFFLF